MTLYSRDAADRLLFVARRAAETVKVESAHLAELAETIIALHDRPAAPEPQIIRTRDELAALDPDTLVTDVLPRHDDFPSPMIAAWPAPVAYRLHLTWSGPMVVIATGDQARAARQALEEA